MWFLQNKVLNVEWSKSLKTICLQFSVFIWFFLASGIFLGLLLFGDVLNVFK